MVNFYVYILTNKNKTVLYTGFTDNLERRVYQHKTKFYKDSFTAKYNCDRLVYFEEFEDKEDALHRENQVKRYLRSYKENLINAFNPEWKDLSSDWY